MCGRYATTRSAPDLAALFEACDDTGGSLAPDYNVAPTDPVPVVRMSRSRGGRVLAVVRWGLVPAWSPDARSGARMINARAETVAGSRAFAPSFERRRCLIPADGWYEWVRGPGGRKQAYYMTAPDGGPLVFAGLWAVRGDLLSCSIITTAAVGDLALVHGRMPLVLPSPRWAGWLGGPPAAPELLAPSPEEFVAGLEIRAVGPAVGSVANDGPTLVAPVAAPPLAAPAEQTVLF